MDWNIALNTAASIARVEARGDFFVDDCVSVKNELISLVDWKPGMNVLIDYRQVSFSHLTLEGLRSIVAFHELLNSEIGNGKMVFLMNSPRDFGLARQYEMIADGKVDSQIRVYLNETDATEWLAEEGT